MKQSMNWNTIKFSHLVLAILGLFTMVGCGGGNSETVDLHPGVEFMLAKDQVADYEADVDHKGIVEEIMEEPEDYAEEGMEIYSKVCQNCHGTPEFAGSLPIAQKFWEGQYKVGSDPFSMYQVLTRGYGAMPAQMQLVPREKYAVIKFIREAYMKAYDPENYNEITSDYLATLPTGNSFGPEPMEQTPHADMDYGDFLINTYELAGKETPEREMSDEGEPLPDEDWSKSNFAYKGVAVRLDDGPGGVS